jgi:hypothetical protein
MNRKDLIKKIESDSLSGVNISKDFEGDLEQLDFSGKDLRNCKFNNRKISSVCFSGAKLHGADFGNSKLTDVHFDGAYMGLSPRAEFIFFVITCLTTLIAGMTMTYGLSLLLTMILDPIDINYPYLSRVIAFLNLLVFCLLTKSQVNKKGMSIISFTTSIVLFSLINFILLILIQSDIAIIFFLQPFGLLASLFSILLQSWAVFLKNRIGDLSGREIFRSQIFLNILFFLYLSIGIHYGVVLSFSATTAPPKTMNIILPIMAGLILILCGNWFGEKANTIAAPNMKRAEGKNSRKSNDLDQREHGLELISELPNGLLDGSNLPFKTFISFMTSFKNADALGSTSFEESQLLKSDYSFFFIGKGVILSDKIRDSLGMSEADDDDENNSSVYFNIQGNFVNTGNFSVFGNIKSELEYAFQQLDDKVVQKLLGEILKKKESKE